MDDNKNSSLGAAELHLAACQFLSLPEPEPASLLKRYPEIPNIQKERKAKKAIAAHVPGGISPF